MQRAFFLLAILPLVGCAAAGPAITSLATAGVAGGVTSATGSAAIGIAAGMGAAVAVDQGIKWGEREITDNVQNAVAAAAGPLEIGQSASWHANEKIPFAGQAGTVEIARGFGQAIPCKDVIFTLDGDEKHDIYTTTICRNDRGDWRWALGEPATHRWGYLQ